MSLTRESPGAIAIPAVAADAEVVESAPREVSITTAVSPFRESVTEVPVSGFVE